VDKKVLNKFLLPALASIFIFIWLSFELKAKNEIWFDQFAFIAAKDSITFRLFTFVTFFGSKWGIIAVGVVFLTILGWKKNYIAMLVTAVTAVGGGWFNQWLKELFERERPLSAGLEEGYSFPSGHAMVGIMFYGFIAYLCHRHIPAMRNAVYFFIVFIFFLGISRIIIGVHYVSDVIAGFTVGYMCLTISILIYEIATKRNERSINKGGGVRM